jgi:hypothetical protein
VDVPTTLRFALWLSPNIPGSDGPVGVSRTESALIALPTVRADAEGLDSPSLGARSSTRTSIYLKGYADAREAKAGISEYFAFYNEGRLHQALGDHAPMAVWREGAAPRAYGHVDNACALTTCPQADQKQQQTKPMAADKGYPADGLQLNRRQKRSRCAGPLQKSLGALGPVRVTLLAGPHLSAAFDGVAPINTNAGANGPQCAKSVNLARHGAREVCSGAP